MPARGGSKRIPGKNFKEFNGVPIIVQVIKTLKSFNFIEKIIVSTDSENIKKLALQEGADVPFMRPPYLSDDHTGTTRVIHHAINELGAELNNLDEIVCVYPTSVFVTSELLARASEVLKLNKDSAVVSIKSYTHPIQRSFAIEKNRLIPFFKGNLQKRTQDLPKAYFDAAQFYLAYKNTWLGSENIIENDCIGIEIPTLGAIDIDNTEDWKNAEILHRFLKSC
jgi:N-acylneuraminate cytidylyltransferase